jgi:flagellin
MALSLANNVGALNAQHNLGRASSKLNTSIERLSSGFKINRGADGPAALVISEKQRAQISGLRAAIDNTEKAVAVVQTAEGALGEINSLMVKIRSLAIDSANTGVNDEDALAANQAEIDNALETIDRIANNTQFGEKRLLDGTNGRSAAVTGTGLTLSSKGKAAAGDYAVAITTAGTKASATGGGDVGTLGANETLTINGVEVALLSGETSAQQLVKINAVSDETGVTAELAAGKFKFVANEFGPAGAVAVVSDVATGATTTGVGTTALTVTAGVDVVGTIGGQAATGVGNVLTGTDASNEGLSVAMVDGSDSSTTGTGAVGSVAMTANAMVFQVGANAGQTVEIVIDSVASDTLGAGISGNSFANLSEINVTTAQGAQDALAVLDASINELSNLRGTLGAFQGNTLESTANNMRTTLENTINAESVIRDTDFAEEISNFTNSQVLVQAGTSVLSNANQTSQLILSLLG